jgi:hypothetical protein
MQLGRLVRQPVTVLVGDQPYSADRVEVALESPAPVEAYFNSLNLESAGVGELALAGLEVRDLPPRLSARIENGALIVEWARSDSPGYRLQSTTDLGSTWTEVAGDSPVVIPLTGPRQFLRLARP